MESVLPKSMSICFDWKILTLNIVSSGRHAILRHNVLSLNDDRPRFYVTFHVFPSMFDHVSDMIGRVSQEFLQFLQYHNVRITKFVRDIRILNRPSKASVIGSPGVGVTNAPFVDFPTSKCFDLAEVPIRFFTFHLYLTGIIAAEMRRHLSNINVIFSIQRVFWEC